MSRCSILLSLLGCWLLPIDVMTFGIESALPMMQDLKTNVPLIHQATSSAFLTYASPHTGIIDFSHSISSISSANNLLASSHLDTAFNIGDSSVSIADFASSVLNDYKDALNRDPLRVKIITGCLLAIVGDAIAQSGQPEDYNKKRAAAFVMFDAVWRTVQQVTYGPIIETCNGKFSADILGSLPFANIKDLLLQEENKIVLGAIEQTLVSQLVLIPLLYYPIFYSVTGVVQSLTVAETMTRAKETFIPLMKRNLLFWIPVQFCAFYYVEENLQIPVLTACGLIWTIILSLSAGNVDSSSEGEKTDIMDGSAVEEKMILDVGVAKGAIGLPKTSFFYGSNVTACGDGSEDNTAEPLTTQPKNTRSYKVGEKRE